MRIDNSIIDLYLDGKPSSAYAAHWVYSIIADGQYLFSEPNASHLTEVKRIKDRVAEACNSFQFRNSDLVFDIFDGIPAIMEHTSIVLTVGLPAMYDAMVREYNGETYVIIDLINFSNYIEDGNDFSDLITNFLSHELIHVLISARYPEEDFDYLEYLNFISFHEGFAHLLSYKENIAEYQPDDKYKEKFDTAKSRLIAALKEDNPSSREEFKLEANSGRYWDKFASISSMLYLMKHICSLKEIFYRGWADYTKRIVNYMWE